MAAEADQLGVRPSVGKNARVDEIVVENDIGSPQTFDAPPCYQAGIAGAGADEIDFADGIEW